MTRLALTTLVRPRSGRVTFLEWLTLLNRAYRQRRALAELPQERLDDLGLTVEEVDREVSRASWDVPSHWLR